jgi:peptide/nickel transport system permease protein
MATPSQKLRFELLRFRRFLGTFVGSKLGVVGLAILIVFLIATVGAPYMTPYDPVEDFNLAASNAAPIWLKDLPPALGGQPDLSENLRPIQNPSFTTNLSSWDHTSAEHVDIEWTESVQGKSGVLTVTFNRDTTGEAYGDKSVVIYQDFFYPFTGPPGAFFGDIVVLVNGTYSIERISYIIVNPNETEFEQGKWFINKTVEKQVLDVPVTLNAFVQRLSDNATWVLWPMDNPDYIELDPTYLPEHIGMSANGTLRIANSTRWITTKDIKFSSIHGSIANYFRGAPEEAIFGKDYVPGSYRYGIRITFHDTNANKTVSAQVNVDTLNFRLWGNAFGLLGTDYAGRDIFSQLIHGTKISLYVGLLSTLLGVVIGLLVGLAAGYMGRTIDEILMRFTDMLLVLPTLPLLIVLMAVLEPTLETLILVLGFLGWMGFARLVRSQVLSLKERPFVEAAKAIGASKTHIMVRHILPNVMSLVYVTLATSVPGNIVAEAALSWLGFYDPYRMSWGRMLYDVQFRAQAVTNWWWVIPPGLAIAALALSFIMLGYALDDILNPKLRKRR